MSTYIEQIEKMIFVVRGQKIMLDADLADLYGVETKKLNQAIRRNMNRFPPDFMFQLTEIEWVNLRSQIVTSSLKYGGRRYLPYVFTEQGLAMLSSILNSERAIIVNISIMRTFVKLRSFLALGQETDSKIAKLESGTNQLFKIVFQRLNDIDEKLEPHLNPERKKIGLKKE